MTYIVLRKEKERLLKKMGKIDILRIIEFMSVTLFGFTSYLYTIWKWTEKNNGLTILYGVIFIIVLFMIPFVYKSYKDWLKEQKEK